MTKINNTKPSLRYSKKKKSFNLKYLNIFLYLGILGFGVFYLFLINDLTVQNFQLQKLNSQSQSLASLNTVYQGEVNTARSSESLNSRLARLNLVPVNNLEYLRGTDSLLAKK